MPVNTVDADVPANTVDDEEEEKEKEEELFKKLLRLMCVKKHHLFASKEISAVTIFFSKSQKNGAIKIVLPCWNTTSSLWQIIKIIIR